MCVQNQSKINQTRKKKKSRSSLKNQINLKSQNKIFMTCECYQTWRVNTIKICISHSQNNHGPIPRHDEATKPKHHIVSCDTNLLLSIRQRGHWSWLYVWQTPKCTFQRGHWGVKKYDDELVRNALKMEPHHACYTSFLFPPPPFCKFGDISHCAELQHVIQETGLFNNLATLRENLGVIEEISRKTSSTELFWSRPHLPPKLFSSLSNHQ